MITSQAQEQLETVKEKLLEAPAEITLADTTQADLERTFSKYQAHSFIRECFIERGFADIMQEHGLPVSLGLETLIQMFLHIKCTPDMLAGMLYRFFRNEENPSKALGEWMETAVEAGFMRWLPEEDKFEYIYGISEEAQERLDNFQYPLPMIEPPMQVTRNTHTGYQTIRGSLILKNNHHNEDICLDHINRANQIPLTVDTDVVAFVKNKWRGLDLRKPDETHADWLKRRRSFDKYDRTARDVLHALMQQGDRFWMTHKYDKRGRTYCQGYHVNYQSNDWCKAIVQFADKETLNVE